MTASVAAVLAPCALAAAWLLAVDPGPRGPGSPLRPEAGEAQRRGAVLGAWRSRTAAGVLSVACSAILLVLDVSPLLLLVGVGVVAVVVVERRRGAARAARDRRAEEVDEAITALAADLRSGARPSSALQAAARASPEVFGDAARGAQWGADPVLALRRSARRPGAEAVADLAVAWQVATRTGCHLADLVDRVRDSVRASLATSREVSETLAPVRATARLLAVLPVAGVGVGAAIGVDVVHLLSTTLWGQACLGAAVLLVAAGLWLVEAIAVRAGG